MAISARRTTSIPKIQSFTRPWTLPFTVGFRLNQVDQINELPNIKTRHKNIDIIIVRENLEGEYSGIEHEVYPGVFESLKVITRDKAMRCANFAFDYALKAGRKKVTCVHKANIMKMVDGLFLNCAIETSKRFPTIQFDEMIVDNTCMQLVKNPSKFDVMLMPNLYGSITSALCAGLVGGAGVVAGSSFGPKYMMFEPGTRKSGHDIAGKGIANPTGILLATCNMLKNCGLRHFSNNLREAIYSVYQEGKYLTPDVGGTAKTVDFTDRVVEEILRLNGTSPLSK